MRWQCQYYVGNGSNRQPLPTSDILNFLARPENAGGEIFVDTRVSDKNETSAQYKIEYSCETGKVRLDDVNKVAGVTNIYPQEYSQMIVRPIEEAIWLLARIQLLEQLYQLNDAGINKIIRDNHFPKDKPDATHCTQHLNLSVVNQSLIRIANPPKQLWRIVFFNEAREELTLTQKEVSKVLQGGNKIDQIRSVRDVNELMGELEKTLRSSAVPRVPAR